MSVWAGVPYRPRVGVVAKDRLGHGMGMQVGFELVLPASMGMSTVGD